jgi:hypothetical protein
MSRDAVLDAFSEGTVTRYYNVPAMADEIVRLRRILDALREPSEAVLKAAVLNYGGDLTDAIRAAVAAAEQEVSNDA